MFRNDESKPSPGRPMRAASPSGAGSGASAGAGGAQAGASAPVGATNLLPRA